MKLESIRPLLEHRKPIMLHHTATAAQAARVMCERGIGSVIVANNDGRILGLVTDRDLACHALQQHNPGQVPLSSIMSSRLITLNENTSPEVAIRTMERHGVRRIPVLERISGEELRCIGILTLDDLIASESVEIRQVAPVVRRQLVRHAAKSESHRQQTMRSFIKKMAQALEMPESSAEHITQFILSALVRRLSFAGASHLVSQLPANLQEDLLSLAPGPDRSITVSSLLEQMSSDFRMEPETARITMIKAFAGLTEFLEAGEIEHVKSQLPEDFRALFVGPERARSKMSA